MSKQLISLIAVLAFCTVVYGQHDSVRLEIPSQNEHWWIGITNHGHLMPLRDGYSANLLANIYGNQGQPLLLSSNGRVVWSDEPFKISFQSNTIHLVKAQGEFNVSKHGNTLREAYLFATEHYMKPSGKMPAEFLFTNPQYNTWIELLYNQNQKDVLSYARAVKDNGFPPGVVMIDDNWQYDYGVWNFRADRFPDPKAMIDTLHQWGFKVMLWICPFVSPDSEVYRELERKGVLLMDSDGLPKMVRWWNGASAVLDFTDDNAVKWYNGELQKLALKYGVDGFKFDAGDPEFYIDAIADRAITPNEHAELFARIGTDYPYNEYRATWKMGGQPLAQRLRDKGHSWQDLQVLLPDILLQGIMGYPFTCPDMIGGGEMGSFLNLQTINQELVVRSAQCHIFTPMMQFSVAPWRILDTQHLSAIKKAVEIRQHYAPMLLQLAQNSAKTGEPIVRLMEYQFPAQGFTKITDQFMVGDSILVAPILKPGNTRTVKLPKGKWLDANSKKILRGPKSITVTASIEQLPFFIKQ
jgi:alpha-glucosidase (family GH31 glycosyl hydrolase)